MTRPARHRRSCRRGVLSAPLLRVLAVAWLALLSPALCCCGIRSSIAGAVALVAGAGDDSASPPSCPMCAAHGMPRASDAPSQAPPLSTCHCHEIGRDAALAATIAIDHVPTLVPAFLAPATTVVVHSSMAAMAADAPRGPPPRTMSLVALHCMLNT